MPLTLPLVTEDDYTLVQNLIRFYIYDLSEYMGWAAPADGLFGGVDDQPHYFGRLPENESHRWEDGWTGIGHKIVVDGEIAGFCLVRRFQKDGTQLNDIGEFFVLRKFRRQGLGRQVAHTIFDHYPGRWQVRQLPENRPAQTFWVQTIAAYTAGRFEDVVEDLPEFGEMRIQKFTSPAATADE